MYKPLSISFKLIFLLTYFSLSYHLILCQDLVARYEFNNSAIDLSRFRNHGKVKGNVIGASDRFGNPCSAYLFDGKTGFIEVTSSSSLESLSTKVSFTVWYKLSNDLSSVKWLTILCKGGNSSESLSSPQYRMQIYQNSDFLPNTCSPIISSPNSTISLNTEFTLCDEYVTNHFFPIDSWHFYALTYDGFYVRSYMDGQKVFEKQYNGVFHFNQESLFIGKDIPGNTEYFNGAMDDLRIYDGPLSDLQIQNIYKEKNIITNIEDDPIVQFPQDLNYNTEPGKCSAVARFTPPVVSRDCLPFTVTQIEGMASGSNFPVGRTRIKYKISSNTSSAQFATFYVNVVDREAPLIKPMTDTIILLNSTDSSVRFSYPMATATDNCAVKSINLISGKPSGSLFEVGEHIFSFTAEDRSGNTSYASFRLTVIQNQSAPPIIDIPATPPIINISAAPPPPQDTNYIYKDTLSSELYKRLNLIVLIDISSSMDDGNKFSLLKASLKKLISSIRSNDQLTILAFSDKPVIIHNTSTQNDRVRLLNMIGELKASGGTNIEEGLDFAYDLMAKVHINDASNQVLLFTDGSFDLSTKQKKRIKSASDDYNKNVNLAIFNILSVGKIIYDLKTIAEKTGGDYMVISNSDEAINKTINFIKLKSLK